MRRTKRSAAAQSRRDRSQHRESFQLVGDEGSPYSPRWKNRDRCDFRPWGDEEELDERDACDARAPKQYLRRSLVGDGNLNRTESGYPPGSIAEQRVHNVNRRLAPGRPSDVSVYEGNGQNMYTPLTSLAPAFSAQGKSLEPVGYAGPRIAYGNYDNSPCQSYFFHLDTCRRCQRKLKRRVLRYLRALQKSKQNPLLPGARGMDVSSADKELFRDSLADNEEPDPDTDEETEEKKESKEKTTEGFTDGTRHNLFPAVFLMLFGLFVIFALDSSKKVFKGLRVFRG